MKDIKPFEVQRPWGVFRQFTLNTASTVKILTVKPGESLSLQSHAKRVEFWRVISGFGTVEIDDATHQATEGKEYSIPIDAKHRVSAGENGISLLEIATGDFLEEIDEVRFEDKYGRA